MLTIRQEQMEVLDLMAREQFLMRVAAFLRRALPDETVGYDDRELLAYIEASERRAARHRIETEHGIAQWVCVAMLMGFYFDDEPSMQEFLAAPGMHAEEKLDAFVDGLNEALLDPGSTGT